MQIGNIELKWLGNSGFLIKHKQVIYIDPYMISDNLEKADIIFITHSHYDHCSIADIQKISKENTIIVIPVDAQSKITKFPFKIDMRIIEPNQTMDFGMVKISSVPAYNIHKTFHPKEENWLGYVLKFDDFIIYHAGDTDLIPEMQKLTGFRNGKTKFVALLPVSGRFVMTAEEASLAASIIKPDIAIPMHYGSVAGSIEDAEEFVKLCKEKNIIAQILDKE